MARGHPKTAKWFSILADSFGPEAHDARLYELTPAAYQVLVTGIGYMCKQGTNHVPKAIPGLAVGPRRAKRAVDQLIDLGYFVPDVDLWGSYRVAHEGILWRRGRVPESRDTIPDAIKAQVYERDSWACVECGATEWLSLDHIFPWSLGGSDEPTNLRVLCRSCNSRKGARV